MSSATNVESKDTSNESAHKTRLQHKERPLSAKDAMELDANSLIKMREKSKDLFRKMPERLKSKSKESKRKLSKT